MTGKQSLVGWLGLGLIIANVLDGSLRPVLSLLVSGGSSYGGSGGQAPLGPIHQDPGGGVTIDPNPANPFSPKYQGGKGGFTWKPFPFLPGIHIPGT